MGIFGFFKNKNHYDAKEEEAVDSIEDEEIYEDIDETYTNESVQYNFEIKDDTEEVKAKEIEDIAQEMSPERLDYIITEQIINVIDNYDDFESVQDTVKQAVKAIGINNADILKDYLKGRVSRPQRLKMKYEEFGQWSKTVENAVLTILYGFEDAGVDELLKISIMLTDVRFKAINLLCKLAARGIEKDKIIDSIIYIMKPMREEEVMKVLTFLSQVKNSPKVDRLLELYYKKYLVESKLEDAYDTVINRVNMRGYYKEDELIFFKVLALYDGKLDMDLILPGEKGIIDFTNVEDELRVKAAISYYSLNKDDKEINYRLLYLRDNSLDLELRKFLAATL